MGHHQLDSLDEQILRLIVPTMPVFPFWRWHVPAMYQVLRFISVFRS